MIISLKSVAQYTSISTAKPKALTVSSTGKDVQKQELLFVRGHAIWYSRFGKQFHYCFISKYTFTM